MSTLDTNPGPLRLVRFLVTVGGRNKGERYALGPAEAAQVVNRRVTSGLDRGAIIAVDEGPAE